MNVITCYYPWMDLNAFEAVWFGKTILNSSRTAYEAIRTSKPDCKILRYISGCTTIDAKSKNPDWFEDWWDFKQMRPEWFLLQDVAKPSQEDNWITYAETPKYEYFVDLTHPDFQTWAIGEVLRKIEIDRLHPQYNFSGLSWDSFLLGQFVKDRFATFNWQYKGREAEWDAKCIEFMRKVHDTLKAKGYFLGINPSLSVTADLPLWQGIDFCDMVMMEVQTKKVTPEIANAIKHRCIESKVPILVYGFGSTYTDFLVCEALGEYGRWCAFRCAGSDADSSLEKSFYV